MSTQPRYARFALAYTCAATLLLALGLEVRAQAATPPPPATATRYASFERTLNSGTDFGWRVDRPFSVTRTSAVGGADGSYAARIVTNGGNSGCSCARMTFQKRFAYGRGDTVWMGGSWYVTDPDKLAWSRLMNLGHFEGSSDRHNWLLGLLIRESGMSVQARRYHTGAGRSVLMTPRAIPQGRWFDVDVRLKLSPVRGKALTEVYVDGQLVSSTTKRNMLSGGRLTFYNAGLPYFWPGNGNTTVYFDAPRLTD
jgi:hypothetical protein